MPSAGGEAHVLLIIPEVLTNRREYKPQLPLKLKPCTHLLHIQTEFNPMCPRQLTKHPIPHMKHINTEFQNTRGTFNTRMITLSTNQEQISVRFLSLKQYKHNTLLNMFKVPVFFSFKWLLRYCKMNHQWICHLRLRFCTF